MFDFDDVFNSIIKNVECDERIFFKNSKYIEEIRCEMLFNVDSNLFSIILNPFANLIFDLFNYKKIKFRPISSNEIGNNKDKNSSNIYFAFFLIEEKQLLLFKEPEKSKKMILYQNGEFAIEQSVQELMDKCGANSVQYIYFLKNNAYKQCANYIESINTPDKGTRMFGFYWLFDTFFSNERDAFFKALDKFNSRLNNELSYSVLPLTNNYKTALFMRKVMSRFLNFPYKEYLNKKENKHANVFINENDFEIIKKNFMNNIYYSFVYSSDDYAKSFITAEWLFEQIDVVKNIDLSPICEGYTKSMEQLMFKLLKFHSGQGIRFKTGKYDKNGNAKYAKLDSELKEESNMTLGMMPYFYRDNLELFIDEISDYSKNYVKEVMFNYSKKCRNGFSHKDNLYDTDVALYIRKQTYLLLFLIFGSLKINDVERNELGCLKLEHRDDLYKLSEYVEYHLKDYMVYSIEFNNSNKMELFGMRCNSYISNGHIFYPNVYFSISNRIFSMKKDLDNRIELLSDVKKISVGKLRFDYVDGKVEIIPKDFKTIYENNVFISMDILNEEQSHYWNID